MKFIKKHTTLMFLGLLGLIATIVYHTWLSFDIFTNGDFTFAFAQTAKEYLTFFIWNYANDLGSVNLVLWRLPITYLYGLIGMLGFDTGVSDKFLLFWPTLVIANLSIFFLIKKITKSSFAGFVGAIVFNYNTYYFIAGTAFLLYSAAAFSLLTLLIFISALEKRKLYLFLISSLTLFICGSYDFRIAYITIFLLIFYFLFHNFYIEKFSRKVCFSNLIGFSLQGLLFIILNLYWVLSFFASKSLISNSILDRGLFGNEFLNIIYAISFYHPFWTGKEIAVFNPQPVIFYFWMIPLFAFLGLWLNRNNKYIVFFGILALLGIFFTKQVGHPFTEVYPFLFKHFPEFNAFREASKFYYLIALGYSVLIGSFISWMWTSWKGVKLKNYAKYFFTIVIILTFLINTIPIINGVFGNIYVPHKVPKDYLIFKEFILKDKNYSRTFWIPYFSRWGFVNYLHPEAIAVNLVYKDWNEFVLAKENPNILLQGELIPFLLNQKYAENLVNLSSIKYLIVPIEDKINYDDFFLNYGKSRQYYIDQLDKIPYLHRINIGTKDLVVYENYGSKPHIYLTQMKESINKNQKYQAVDYQFINGSEYKIQLKNITNPVYLNFSESYHPQWKIYLGNFKWYDVLFNKQKAISDKYHFQNDATLNSFYLDPRTVCKVDSCKVNKNGSFDINLTLYFAPQSYMDLGLLIGGGTLALVLGYFVFVFVKNLYGKN